MASLVRGGPARRPAKSFAHGRARLYVVTQVGTPRFWGCVVRLKAHLREAQRLVLTLAAAVARLRAARALVTALRRQWARRFCAGESGIWLLPKPAITLGRLSSRRLKVTKIASPRPIGGSVPRRAPPGLHPSREGQNCRLADGEMGIASLLCCHALRRLPPAYCLTGSSGFGRRAHDQSL